MFFSFLLFYSAAGHGDFFFFFLIPANISHNVPLTMSGVTRGEGLKAMTMLYRFMTSS